MKTNYISQEELHRNLDYNPETGVFTRKIVNGYARCIHVGDVAGCLNHGYIKIKLNGKTYPAHRLAWIYVYGDIPDGFEIDHKEGKEAGNGIENLRCVIHAVNGQNRRSCQENNKSGFLGVGWHKAAEKWYARIKLNGKSKFLGSFDLPELAYEAYLAAKRELHQGCTI